MPLMRNSARDLATAASDRTYRHPQPAEGRGRVRVAAEEPDGLMEHGAERDQIPGDGLACAAGLHQGCVDPGRRILGQREIVQHACARSQLETDAVARENPVVLSGKIRVGASGAPVAMKAERVGNGRHSFTATPMAREREPIATAIQMNRCRYRLCSPYSVTCLQPPVSTRLPAVADRSHSACT